MPYMTNEGINAGIWWRFSRYELRSGYICPAPKAKLRRYEPWRLATRPYESLLALIRDLRIDFNAGMFVSSATRHGEVLVPKVAPGGIEKVLAWCGRYGLFGILLQQVRAITLAPRWARGDTTRKFPKSYLVAQLQEYVRGHAGRSVKASESTIRKDMPPGGLVPREIWPTGWPAPGAYVDSLYPLGNVDFHGVGSAHQPFPLGDTVAHYMLDVPPGETETYGYPVPYSDQFWRQYGESLVDFLGAAQTFSRALEAFAPRGPRAASTVSPEVVRVRGKALLQGLLTGVGPALERRPDGSYRRIYLAQSLLAALTAMAVEDVTQGGRIRRCSNTSCHSPFVTKSPRGRYCSSRCRGNVEQRSYRRGQQKRIATTLRALLPDASAADRARLVRSLTSKYQSERSLREHVRSPDGDVEKLIVRLRSLSRREVRCVVRGLAKPVSSPLKKSLRARDGIGG